MNPLWLINQIQKIKIEIFDKDFISSDDLIGAFYVGIPPVLTSTPKVVKKVVVEEERRKSKSYDDFGQVSLSFELV